MRADDQTRAVIEAIRDSRESSESPAPHTLPPGPATDVEITGPAGEDVAVGPIARGSWMRVLYVSAVMAILSATLFLTGTALWPRHASALCKDFHFSESESRSGTCSRHHGVLYWRYAATNSHWTR